jgi:hypothetical protein
MLFKEWLALKRVSRKDWVCAEFGFKRDATGSPEFE